jgi:sigma-B regulation protein RsbQ
MTDFLARHHVTVRGHGRRALLLLHGFGTDQTSWRHVLPALEEDHLVVSMDHLGFGRSRLEDYDPRRHASLQGYAQDVLDVVDALRTSGRLHDGPLSCIGHSAGGIIALLAALPRPGLFRRVVTLGSSPHFLNQPPDYHGGFEADEIEGLLDLMESDQIAWAHALAPQALGPDGDAAQVQAFGDSLCALDAVVGRRFARLVFLLDERARMTQVRVPTLVLQCAHDSIVPVSVGRWLQAHIPGALYEELDASGHCPHLTHPHATGAALLRCFAMDAQVDAPSAYRPARDRPMAGA